MAEENARVFQKFRGCNPIAFEKFEKRNVKRNVKRSDDKMVSTVMREK